MPTVDREPLKRHDQQETRRLGHVAETTRGAGERSAGQRAVHRRRRAHRGSARPSLPSRSCSSATCSGPLLSSRPARRPARRLHQGRRRPHLRVPAPCRAPPAIFVLFATVVYGSFLFLGLAWIYTPLIVGTAALLLLRFRLAVAVLSVVTVAEFPLTLALRRALPHRRPCRHSAAVLVASVVAAGHRPLRQVHPGAARTAGRPGRDGRGRGPRCAWRANSTTCSARPWRRSGSRPRWPWPCSTRTGTAPSSEIEATILIASEAREEIGDVVAARRSLDLGAELSAAVALIELTGAHCDLRLGITRDRRGDRRRARVDRPRGGHQRRQTQRRPQLPDRTGQQGRPRRPADPQRRRPPRRGKGDGSGLRRPQPAGRPARTATSRRTRQARTVSNYGCGCPPYTIRRE